MSLPLAIAHFCFTERLSQLVNQRKHEVRDFPGRMGGTGVPPVDRRDACPTFHARGRCAVIHPLVARRRGELAVGLFCLWVWHGSHGERVQGPNVLAATQLREGSRLEPSLMPQLKLK